MQYCIRSRIDNEDLLWAKRFLSKKGKASLKLPKDYNFIKSKAHGKNILRQLLKPNETEE